MLFLGKGFTVVACWGLNRGWVEDLWWAWGFFPGGFLASCSAAFGRGGGSVWIWLGFAAALKLGDKDGIFFNRLVAELVQVVFMAHLNLHRLLWKMMAAFLSSLSRLVERWVRRLRWRYSIAKRAGRNKIWLRSLSRLFWSFEVWEGRVLVWVWQQWHQAKQSISQDPSHCASYALVSVCWIEILREEKAHQGA